MNKKNVLIMMATYNGQQFLRKQLDSILNQTYSKFHLAIQDDGSDDKTIEIINEYKEKDYRLEILSNNFIMHGAYYNFHLLANKFKKREPYDYYMFCDQDDIWDTDKVERMVNLISNEKEEYPVLLYADMRLIDGKGNNIGNSLEHILYNKYVNKYTTFFAHNVYGCNLIMNNAAFFGVPEIDLNDKIVRILSHDNLYAKFTAFLGNVIYYPEITMSYRRYGGNVSASQKYTFNLARLIERLFNIKSLERDHSLAYSQSLYAIKLLRKVYGENKELNDMEQAINDGGIKCIKYINRNNISWGRTEKNISRKLVILFGLYKKHLIFN